VHLRKDGLKKLRLSIFGLALAAGFAASALSCVNSAHAQTVAYKQESTLLETQQLILALIAEGRFDEAFQVAENFEPDHPNHAARVAFVRGLAAKAQGKNRVAARAFRDVLAVQPDLIPARQQLAHALFLDGDNEAASHHFKILAANETDPNLRTLYSSFETAIEQRQPWQASGYVTTITSSNTNKGSNHSSFEALGLTGNIDKKARKKAGIGVSAGAFGSYDWLLGEGLSLRGAASVDTRTFRETEESWLGFATSLKPAVTSEDGRLRVALGPSFEAGVRGYDDLSYLRSGIAGDITAILDQGLVFSGSASALYQNYDDQDVADGWRYSLDTQLIKSLSATTSVGVNAGLFVEKLELDRLSHLDWTVGASLSQEWQGGFITRVAPFVSHHKYDGKMVFKPEARSDWAYGVSTQVSNRQLEAYGFSPVLNYSYTRQKSNDPFSDYDSHDLFITLTRAF
jgi:outer membrane protein